MILSQRRARLMAHLVIGTICLCVPLSLFPSPPTADPALHSKILALEVLGAGLLLPCVIGWRPRACTGVWRALAPASLLALWLLITSALSHWPLSSVASLWPMVIGLAIFAVTQTRVITPRRTVALWGLLGFAASLLCLIALLPNEVLGWQLTGLPARFRYASGFGNPVAFASLLAPILCLWFAKIVSRPWSHPHYAVALAGVLLLWFALLVLTASRGPALGLLGGVTVVGFFAWWRRPHAGRAVLCALVTVFVLTALHVALGPRSPAQPLVGRFQRTLDLHAQSTRLRVLTWTLGSQMLWRSPIFGHGWGSFGLLYQEQLSRNLADDPDGLWELEAFHLDGDIAYHAHCDYLEIAVASGLPGEALFLWLLVGGVVRGVQSAWRSRGAPRWPDLGALSAVVCFALMAAVDFPLQRPAHLVFFWLALGVTHRWDQREA